MTSQASSHLPPPAVFRSATGRTDVAQLADGRLAVRVFGGTDVLDAGDVREIAEVTGRTRDRRSFGRRWFGIGWLIAAVGSGAYERHHWPFWPTVIGGILTAAAAYRLIDWQARR